MAHILKGKVTANGREISVTFLCPEDELTKEQASTWFEERCKERNYTNPELTEFGPY